MPIHLLILFEIESSLNFKDDEHRKLLERVVNLERTVKALELENNALQAQFSTTINEVLGSGFSLLLRCVDVYLA